MTLWRRFLCWRYARMVALAELRGDHAAALLWQRRLEEVAWNE